MFSGEHRSQRCSTGAAVLVVLFAAGAASSGALACSTCNRDGCNAINTPAAESGQASIAGIIALESDVINNGCQECAFSSATLSLWPVSEPVTDNPSANSIVKGGPAALTIQANVRYQQAVDPGSYLLCVSSYCVNISVLDGHVTPVNVLQVYGPVQFKVFDPTTHAAQTTTVFTTNTVLGP